LSGSTGAFNTYSTGSTIGYDTAGSVSEAGASFTVPALASCTAQTATSIWVGVGGFTGGTLLQAGIFYDCDGRGLGAFVEEYPGPTGDFPLAISPGNSVTITLAEEGDSGTWLVTFTDNSTGVSSSTTATPGYDAAGSAGFVIEADGQLASGAYLPQTGFGSLTINGTVNGADIGALPPLVTPASGGSDSISFD
jgi:hypothetical protein